MASTTKDKTNAEKGKTTVAAPSKDKSKTKADASKKPAKASSRAKDQETDQEFAPYEANQEEGYMSAPQRDHFRQILNQWKVDLMEEVDRTVHHMKDESANLPDPVDRASQEEEFSFELRTRDRERKLIKKIEEALEAIDHQEYGYCEACGVEIGIRRLEARPTATQCIDCKTLDEIKEKQTKG